MATQIGGIDTKVEGIDTKVEGIDTKVEGFDTRIGGLNTRITGLDTKIESLQVIITVTHLYDRLQRIPGHSTIFQAIIRMDKNIYKVINEECKPISLSFNDQKHFRCQQLKL